jgi:two-component system NtrC family response regulator
LPFLVRKAFLRVLQEHRFRPVGSSAEISSDFRLIAATNRDLEKMVHEGTFRTDFLFRLRSFIIELPPLRDRAEDIADIATYYVAKLCERHGIGLKGFSPDFMGVLSAYNWPGNVGELLHALERALPAAFHEPTLFPQHLPEHIRIDLATHSIKNTIPPRTRADNDLLCRRAMPSFRNYRENMDRIYLMELTALAGGNIGEACGVSGLSRSRLYDLLKKHNLTNSTQINS